MSVVCSRQLRVGCGGEKGRRRAGSKGKGAATAAGCPGGLSTSAVQTLAAASGWPAVQGGPGAMAVARHGAQQANAGC